MNLQDLQQENNGQYGRANENDATIKFDAKVIKPNLSDYSDSYILLTGDIKVATLLQTLMLHLKFCYFYKVCNSYK